jgi:3-isopropylmalate dehydratase small subunit
LAALPDGRRPPRPFARQGSQPSCRISFRELGLPILEAPGVHELVEDGDRVRVDIAAGTVTNLTTGKSLTTAPPPQFLLDMLRAGGLIPFLESRPTVVEGLDEMSQ